MENQDKPVRKPRTVRKPVKSDMPEIVEPQPAEVDKSDIQPELSLLDKIRIQHESLKITAEAVKPDIPREGDIVAMLDKNGEPVQTYTVRRRGTTMTEPGSNRTYHVPTTNLTKVGDKVWSYPQPTFQVEWDKVFKSDNK